MNLSEWNFCGKKMAHEKLRNANIALKSLIKNKRAKEGEMSAYKCPRCNKYHIGHNKKEQK